MVRHVFVVLLLALSLLQVVLSMPERKRRDADDSTATIILEDIEKLGRELSKSVQELFSGDSLKAMQGNVTEIVNKVSADFDDLMKEAMGTAATDPTAA